MFFMNISILQLPNYKNFKGMIQELGQNQYVVSGEIYVVDRNTVEITELPVRTWTQVSSFKILLYFEYQECFLLNNYFFFYFLMSL